MLSTIFLGSFVCLCAYLVNIFLKQSKLPPGPFGLPLVGYLPFLGKDHHLTLIKVAEKYGSVYSLRLGLENVVVLNDFESIKDALSNPLLLGRPDAIFGNLIKYSGHASINGQEWTEQRRLCQRILHSLGFSRQVMEDNIQDELKYFLHEIDQNSGKPFDVAQALAASVSNNMAYFIFGQRFDYSDPIRKRLNESIASFAEGNQVLSPLNFYKGLAKIAFWFNQATVNKILDGLTFLADLTIKEIGVHEERLTGGPALDFIDGCLKEKQNGTRISDEVIIGNVIEIFGAGSEPVMVTLKWLLLLTAVNPEVQKRVSDEIDNVVGSNRLPKYSDRILMPYTQAVIAETQRWATVLAISIPRRALKDTKVGKHFIPKDTTVFVNLHAAHMDNKVWEDPQKFNPDRFMSENANGLKRFEAVIPFSMGKRSCTGESLARCELFLYYTMILQKYSIGLPEGTKASLKGRLGLSWTPENPAVYVFTKRIE